MGGLGSGNWLRFGKKATVDESLTIRMSQFRDSLNDSWSGSIRWKRYGGRHSSIEYLVTPADDSPTITLTYRWRDQEDISIPIRLKSTPVHFGGRRWWFICPLIVRGIACRRRVGKLYFPPRAKYFGCRNCHSLTYHSSQTAHQMERLYNQLAKL